MEREERKEKDLLDLRLNQQIAFFPSLTPLPLSILRDGKSEDRGREEKGQCWGESWCVFSLLRRTRVGCFLCSVAACMKKVRERCEFKVGLYAEPEETQSIIQYLTLHTFFCPCRADFSCLAEHSNCTNSTKANAKYKNQSVTLWTGV